ncbi:unnamed protein product [Adineta ricciae]|uniref:polynucleotide adenylyltransferase n=1 Tax=Adineta ricciae TaxID=249248 RepID=A0A814ABA3_ADIRI|nr:unnamed protein product [Adineta ricciae]CAF0911717.1 unnamed protein product [Adineta ricciae]
MGENTDTTSDTASTFLDELNSLRSILPSDDHLQIQPSGDFEQVRIKLDQDIQISFFFDSLQVFNQSLTINNLHDLRIGKASNKCPLNQDQWANLRKYFDETLRQSNQTTSLRSIIQLVQDQLLELRVNNQKNKQKNRKNENTTAVAEDLSSSNKFRGGDLIFSRILHDKSIDRSQVVIGYEDRFTGIHEIAFNDFKKVHDDRYGVPMHRIRHFKIGGRTVWDRTKKLDVLTGSEQQEIILNDVGQGIPTTQGLYYFDNSLEQWVHLPHTSLASDDVKIPSTNNSLLPQPLHCLTWNILFDYHHPELIFTPQRYRAILHTLQSLLPDLICLQEVTQPFLKLLLNEMWLQKNNYYIIIMKDIITSEQTKSYGQLMLMKNFQPRALSIIPLESSNEQAAATTTTSTMQKSTKEIIVARFGLNTKVTIDIVNLHLHSNRSRNADEKRCRTLESLFTRLNTQNYMLVGDFNFGDFDLKEQNLLEKYESSVHDLWKKVYDLEQNPGFTYDPSKNMCAEIMSRTQINRRFDRCLVHTLNNLYYSVEHLNMIGTDTIAVDDDSGKRVNLSDHYALQLIINFHTRSISHRSAFVMIPSTEHWPMIDKYRAEYDPSFDRWPAHVNILWPFFDLNGCEDDEENILLPLRMTLCECEAFDSEVNEIATFVENNVCYMKITEDSTSKLKAVYEQVKELFPQCCTNKRNPYTPHMTIAQFDSTEKRLQAMPNLTLEKPFTFPVQHLYVLQRPHDNDTTPFHIAYQLPLGPVLPPLYSQKQQQQQLHQFFQQMDLYESSQLYQQKQDKFSKLRTCFAEIFNKDTLHCFTHRFLPYGSFRIGVKGEDVDTVFLLHEVETNEQRTNLDGQLLKLKNDSTALNNYVVELLETRINSEFKDEILWCRKVQALYPLMYILFSDQTKVEIFVQIKTIKTSSDESKFEDNSNAQDSVHGIDEMEHLLIHARSPPIFQHLLSFVRTWAQHVGLYGQVYAYLGGFSWATLVAHICHSSLSPINSLSSIENFSIDDFFNLVYKFFSTYAQFNWSAQELRLHSKSSQQPTSANKPSVQNRGAMRIISPRPPYNNTARATMHSTRDLIVQGFQRVLSLLNSINTITVEDKLKALSHILQLSNEFPNEKVKTLLQLTLSGANTNELDEWIGWAKSRLAFFLNECESKCHLTFQTQNRIEYGTEKNQAIYSIGFPLDEVSLDIQRNFHYCLKRFLEQFDAYPNRKDTMTISHKLISAHDWKMERMQPKPPRTRNK